MVVFDEDFKYIVVVRLLAWNVLEQSFVVLSLFGEDLRDCFYSADALDVVQNRAVECIQILYVQLARYDYPQEFVVVVEDAVPVLRDLISDAGRTEIELVL